MKSVPGVGEYTLAGIERPFTQSSSIVRRGNTTTFTKDKRGEIKIYDHEYEKDYSNKIGPGPGGYDTISS